MNIEIIEMLIPKSNTFTRPGIVVKPTSITIHETDNTNTRANALAHAKLQQNGNRREASWNYSVDDEPQIYRSLPDDEVTYHAGNAKGNRESISIEICVNQDGNYKKAVKNAIELVRYLLREHKSINAINIVQHNYWSGKNCPRRMRGVTNGVSWNDFIQGVKLGKGDVVIEETDVPDYSTTNHDFKIGDKVRIKKSAKTYATGETIPHQYKGKTDKILQRGSNRMLLNGVYSWVRNKDLELISKTTSKPKPSPAKPKAIRKGSKVTLNNSASKYSTGESIPSKYKGKQYSVMQKSGSKVLLKELMSWVNLADVRRTGSSEKPVKPNFKAGSRVTINSSASTYSRTTTKIPNSYKGKTFTVQQESKDDVLLKELYSWVKKSNLS